MSTMKTCSNKNCSQNNPQPISNFHIDCRKADGHRSRCKACELQRAAEYRAKNRKLLAKKQAAYYKKRGEIQRNASRNWKAKNKDKQQGYWRDWYEENKEHRAEYFRQYQVDKPYVILEKSRRRRARKINAPSSFTEADFQRKLAEHGFKCFYCGKELKKGDITRDHYIPISKGGSDSIINIVPACRSCNCRKRNKMPHEFMLVLATLNQAAEGHGSAEGATTRR